MSSPLLGAGILRSVLNASEAAATTSSYCSFVVILTVPNSRLSIGELEVIVSLFSIHCLPVEVPWIVPVRFRDSKI